MQIIILSFCTQHTLVMFYFTKDVLNAWKYNVFVFTVWRDVGEGDLHEALQAEEDHTSVDDRP